MTVKRKTNKIHVNKQIIYIVKTRKTNKTKKTNK